MLSLPVTTFTSFRPVRSASPIIAVRILTEAASELRSVDANIRWIKIQSLRDQHIARAARRAIQAHPQQHLRAYFPKAELPQPFRRVIVAGVDLRRYKYWSLPARRVQS